MLSDIDGMNDTTQAVQKTDNASDIHGMHKAVQEVLKTNTLLLDRLNQIVSVDELPCTCKCGNEDVLKDLVTRVHQLEDQAKQQDDLIHTMTQTLKTLQKELKQKEPEHSHLHTTGNKQECILSKTKTDSSVLSSNANKLHSVEIDREVGNGQTRHKHHENMQDFETENNSAVPTNTDESSSQSTHIKIPIETKNKDTSKREADDNKRPNEVVMNHHATDYDKPLTKTKENVSDNMFSKTTSRPSKHSEPSEIKNDLESTADSSVTVTEYRTDVIKTANFTKQAAVDKTGVKIIEQREKQCLMSHMVWDMMAAQEQTAGSQSGLKDLGGVHTVICLDISASIANGDAWLQAKTFVTDYISGLEGIRRDLGIQEEHVALVTFGHETKVVQRLTNDISKLRQAFGNIKLGGPSPMYGGVMMSIAAAQSSNAIGAVVNGIQVFTKIILITDGQPTDGNMYAGPDVETINNQDETKSTILMQIAKIQSSNMDLFCVPVGVANMEFLELLVSVADGKMMSFKNGRKLSRRLFLTLKANQDPLGMAGPMFGSFGFNTDSHRYLSDSDREQMQEIIEDGRKKMFSVLERNNEREENQYHESKSETLPQIGSRVGRGPDWRYPDQDSHRPGTVIGHNADDQRIWVEWDADENRNVYNYGGGGQYDVLLVDESRVIKPGGKIAVGCVVKSGPHWTQGYTKVDADESGVVIKVFSNAKKVQVRWNNGERGDYSYGDSGVYEVELSQQDTAIYDPHTTRPDGRAKETMHLKKKNNRNKNKNTL